MAFCHRPSAIGRVEVGVYSLLPRITPFPDQLTVPSPTDGRGLMAHGSMTSPDIDLTVYPDECDAFGHLNQASFLSLFERARWEMLARGPGMDVFTRNGAWPAVRKTSVDYHAAALPGDILRFAQTLVHHGRTSFTMRQTARRVKDDTDRKSTRLNSSHGYISYAVFCLKKKKK